MPLLGILWVEAKPPQRTHSTATQVAGCRVQRRFSALEALSNPRLQLSAPSLLGSRLCNARVHGSLST
ncbi:hypothetical protein KOJCDNHJ_02213 [Xanthomonas citri pv. punicae]|nr:hypothetical protein FICKIIDM_03939 [Xanthomonas citri pv. punicae]UIS28816.1 hypothetical protein KOJCDNHJ_02213 [Xanthomonas citri pv. punicae]